MSWLFSQALVEEYSAAPSWDGELSALLSGLPIQLAFCSPDKMTEFSRLSRFGMTFRPLTATHGKALLMSYLAGFRAKTLVQQGGGKGIEGERSGMWRHMARIIGEVLPRFVFVENSPMLVGRGLAVVVSDLAKMGYDAEWVCLSASDVGAPHKRDRIWLVAYANSMRKLQPKGDQQDKRRRLSNSSSNVADSSCVNVKRQLSKFTDSQEWQRPKQRQIRSCADGARGWPTEPDVGRVAHGVAARVDRLKAIGNGQVPRVAATAFTLLTHTHQK